MFKEGFTSHASEAGTDLALPLLAIGGGIVLAIATVGGLMVWFISRHDNARERAEDEYIENML